jgi:superfamily I DNA/RNA helicase
MHRFDLQSFSKRSNLLHDDENEASRAAQMENEAFQATQTEVFVFFAFCLQVMHRLDSDSMILETIKFVAENEAFRAAQIENEAFQATQMQAFAFVLHFVCIL